MGAAPGDAKGSPGGSAGGAAGSLNSTRAARARGTSSGGDDRDPSPAGPAAASQPPDSAPARSDEPAVPPGLTQVGDDLSPAEEAALIAGKWR